MIRVDEINDDISPRLFAHKIIKSNRPSSYI